MREPLSRELDPYELTVLASVVAEQRDATVLRATVEDGTGADGGEVELRITKWASSAYGLNACVNEFERFLNAALRPEYRLEAALAMGRAGAFTVVIDPGSGPRVIAPERAGREDLAA